jgi:hypothetical protein
MPARWRSVPTFARLDVDEIDGAASARTVSLRNCSTWSRDLPEGEVMWGCTGRGVCEDEGLWMAGPNRSYCWKQVEVCKNGNCTTATVKDVSVSRDWEASNSVMGAVGLPDGLAGRCSGFGGGRVTVKVL